VGTITVGMTMTTIRDMHPKMFMGTSMRVKTIMSMNASMHMHTDMRTVTGMLTE
jgi:hypothetical protein